MGCSFYLYEKGAQGGAKASLCAGTPGQTLTGGLPLISHDYNLYVVNRSPSRLS